MRAKGMIAGFLLAMVLASSIAGCLEGNGTDNGGSPITMNLHYEATSGTITERVQNNAVLSQSGVELSFDFARVTSKAGAMKTFSLNPGDDVDGSNTITVNANEQAELTYTYLTHGLFTAVLTATDEGNNTASVRLTIRIDKEIDWTQTNTQTPTAMSISTVPDCQCDGPEKISVESTISNPNELVPGTHVTTTWHLNDPDEVERARHTEQIADGQDASWTHNEYNLQPGQWSLEVTIDSGNDSINIHHVVQILYEHRESPPNPLTLDAPQDQHDSLSILRNENEK
jgi:hypothetical protein